jgi:diaminopimelate epimerase
MADVERLLPKTVMFTKMTAGGNDFVCIDNTRGDYEALLKSPSWPEFVRTVCRRGLCVGADGVIVACGQGSGQGIDIVARFLEPDGSEARLCGNGTACFAYWCLTENLVSGPKVDILTAAGTAQARPNPDDCSRIRVCVPNPQNLVLGRQIMACKRTWTVHTLDTGVPHAVVFVRDVARVDVSRCGAAIRHHEAFRAVGGVNANFVQVLAVGHLRVRTFEFGVEAETLACGTGSTAAAIIAAITRQWPAAYTSGTEPVLVEVRGEETLRIWFTLDPQKGLSDVCLETRARAIYTGILRPEFVHELYCCMQPG